jgi:hypothetical protein
MSSGHASHKGSGTKHSHDTGQLDSAATTPVNNPEDLLAEAEGYPFNAQGNAPKATISGADTPEANPSGRVNPAATERPEQLSEQ